MILLSDSKDLPLTGKFLKMMRKRRGVTQAQLGEMLGLKPGQTSVSSWERGRNERGVPLHQLVKLADLLECDIIIDFRERDRD